MAEENSKPKRKLPEISHASQESPSHHPLKPPAKKQRINPAKLTQLTLTSMLGKKSEPKDKEQPENEVEEPQATSKV